MTHLDETSLNEYADQALSAAQRQEVEAHLAACAQCRSALAELQTLFTTLESLPDVPLTTDLSAQVVARIEPRPAQPRWSAVLLLLQIVAAGVMLVLLWPTIRSLLAAARQGATAVLQGFSWPQFGGWETLLAGGTAVLAQARSWEPLLDLATNQWVVILGLALVLWLAGNRLIFVDTMNHQGERHG